MALRSKRQDQGEIDLPLVELRFDPFRHIAQKIAVKRNRSHHGHGIGRELFDCPSLFEFNQPVARISDVESAMGLRNAVNLGGSKLGCGG